VLSFAGSLRVFLVVEPCDMRKGFEGLHGLVGEQLREDARGGALFVFTNTRHTPLKQRESGGGRDGWMHVEVSFGRFPIVGSFREQCAHQAEKGGFVWKDGGDAGARLISWLTRSRALLVRRRRWWAGGTANTVKPSGMAVSIQEESCERRTKSAAGASQEMRHLRANEGSSKSRFPLGNGYVPAKRTADIPVLVSSATISLRRPMEDFRG
jgi:transposase